MKLWKTSEGSELAAHRRVHLEHETIEHNTRYISIKLLDLPSVLPMSFGLKCSGAMGGALSASFSFSSFSFPEESLMHVCMFPYVAVGFSMSRDCHYVMDLDMVEHEGRSRKRSLAGFGGVGVLLQFSGLGMRPVLLLSGSKGALYVDVVWWFVRERMESLPLYV